MDYSTDRNAWLCESLYEEIEDRLLSIFLFCLLQGLIVWQYGWHDRGESAARRRRAAKP